MKGSNTKAAGRKGAAKADKPISQKLGTGTMKMQAKGMALSTHLEGAAEVAYKGHSQGPGVKHGTMGVLAGKGGKRVKDPGFGK